MSPRDLYFVASHQAAHVVIAVSLGYSVDHVEITDDGGDIGWNLDSASVADIEAICGAGFAMERVLGRMHDQAWKRCEDDRNLMNTLLSRRSGAALEPKEAEARFLAGAESCNASIDKKATRRAIDDLADTLSDLFLSGGSRLNGPVVSSMVGASSPG